MGSEFLTDEDFSETTRGGGGNSPPFLENEKSLQEVFDEYYIYFISMDLGITRREFWEQNHSVDYYRKANEIKLARENYLQWRQGIYMMRAIGACFGGEKVGYFSEPLPMNAKEQVLQEERERKKKYLEMMKLFQKDVTGAEHE